MIIIIFGMKSKKRCFENSYSTYRDVRARQINSDVSTILFFKWKILSTFIHICQIFQAFGSNRLCIRFIFKTMIIKLLSPLKSPEKGQNFNQREKRLKLTDATITVFTSLTNTFYCTYLLVIFLEVRGGGSQGQNRPK